MTDDEIISKLLEIKIKEKMNQKQLSSFLRMGLTSLNGIINRKQKICDHRRRILEMTFKMYDSGILK